MTSTTYLKLEKPPFDTAPWDEAVNNNMDIIDAFVSQFMSVPNFAGVWTNLTNYLAGQVLLDPSNGVLYRCAITHLSAASPTTFAQDRVANPTYWVSTTAGFTPADFVATTNGVMLGTPTAPTAAVDTNTTQVATTAMVVGQAAAATPLPNSVAAAGTSKRYARADHVHDSTPDVGRNKVHNPLFNIAQRGVGPFTTTVYTLDRWLAGSVLDTFSFTPSALADADRTAIGDEEAVTALQNVFVGNAGATAFSSIVQRIEGVRRLAGKTITVSFWAKAASGTPKLGVSIDQVFGSGGSPSAGVTGTGATVTLSTTMTRYNVPLVVASAVGKTFGSTVNTDYSQLNLWYSSGANNATRAGTPGVQSGTISLWGVQLEIGSVATPLEKPDPQIDLANCQRFYLAANTWVPNGTQYAVTFVFPTTMRATPTAAGGGAGYAAGVINATSTTHTQTASAAQNMTFSADL